MIELTSVFFIYPCTPRWWHVYASQKMNWFPQAETNILENWATVDAQRRKVWSKKHGHNTNVTQKMCLLITSENNPLYHMYWHYTQYTLRYVDKVLQLNVSRIPEQSTRIVLLTVLRLQQGKWHYLNKYNSDNCTCTYVNIHVQYGTLHLVIVPAPNTCTHCPIITVLSNR